MLKHMNLLWAMQMEMTQYPSLSCSERNHRSRYVPGSRSCSSAQPALSCLPWLVFHHALLGSSSVHPPPAPRASSTTDPHHQPGLHSWMDMDVVDCADGAVFSCHTYQSHHPRPNYMLSRPTSNTHSGRFLKVLHS